MKIDKFNVRIVFKGDTYGLNGCLTHEKDEPLVEFYDSRYPHTEWGQFVSRYYVSTILQMRNDGLCLHGGVEAWSVSSKDMATVRTWLYSQTKPQTTSAFSF